MWLRPGGTDFRSTGRKPCGSLAAIAAHPEEDTPRLAYADWLDEHGFPIRAEFIRIQCEIDKLKDLASNSYLANLATSAIWDGAKLLWTLGQQG